MSEECSHSVLINSVCTGCGAINPSIEVEP
jgi:hypothetical protein